MFVKQLSLLALASQAFAQNTPSLAQALNSSTDLTTLSTVLGLVPELVTALGSAQNITILAPSNAAFAKVDNATLSALQSNTGLLTALLQCKPNRAIASLTRADFQRPRIERQCPILRHYQHQRIRAYALD